MSVHLAICLGNQFTHPAGSLWVIPHVSDAKRQLIGPVSLLVSFLQGSPDAFMARKEIARKAVKRSVFEEDPHWADAALASLHREALRALETFDRKVRKLAVATKP